MSINDPRAYSSDEVQAMLSGLSVHRVWFDGNTIHTTYVKRQAMYRDDLEKTQPLPHTERIGRLVTINIQASKGFDIEQHLKDGMVLPKKHNKMAGVSMSYPVPGLRPWLASNDRRSSKEFREAESTRAYNKIMAHLRALGGVSSTPS